MVRKLRTVLCVVLPACALAMMAPAAAPAAVDMYFQAPGLEGESTSAAYKDAIDVLAWSWGSSRAGTKVNVQDLSFTKYIDRSSPKLFSSVTTGVAVPSAKLTVVRPGENPAPFLRLCMTGVRITSISTGGSGGEDRLTENVTVSFATIVEAYQRQKADGNLEPTVFGGFDLINRLQYGDPAC